MKPLIRIASGQGFWGDLQRAPIDQVRRSKGNTAIDYMMLDYLAEVTMSIMQKQRQKRPVARLRTRFPRSHQRNSARYSRKKYQGDFKCGRC